MRLSCLGGCPIFYKEEFDEHRNRVARSRKNQQCEIAMEKRLEKSWRDRGPNHYADFDLLLSGTLGSDSSCPGRHCEGRGYSPKGSDKNIRVENRVL